MKAGSSGAVSANGTGSAPRRSAIRAGPRTGTPCPPGRASAGSWRMSAGARSARTGAISAAVSSAETGTGTAPRAFAAKNRIGKSEELPRRRRMRSPLATPRAARPPAVRRTVSASLPWVQLSERAPSGPMTSSARRSGARADGAKVWAAMLNGAGQGAKGPASKREGSGIAASRIGSRGVWRMARAESRRRTCGDAGRRVLRTSGNTRLAGLCRCGLASLWHFRSCGPWAIQDLRALGPTR